MCDGTFYTYRGKAKIPKVQTKQKVPRISLLFIDKMKPSQILTWDLHSSYSNLVINYLITTVSSSLSNFLKSWDAWKFVNSLVQQCWRWCKALHSLSVSGKDFCFMAKFISAFLTGTLEPKSLALSALSTPGGKKSLKDLTFVLFFVFWREKSKQ